MFLVLQSFAKNNLQGIIYLCGLILAESFGYLVRPIFGNMGVKPEIVALENGKRYIRRGRACSIVEDPWLSKYGCPDFNALFHSFTIVYIFAEDFSSGKGLKNIGLLITFILLYILDMIFRLSNFCVFISHWVIGTFMGILLGWVWYMIISSTNQKLVYNSFVTDKKSCKITKSNFSCKMRVWKNENDKWVQQTNEDLGKLGSDKWGEILASQNVDSSI